MDKTLEASKSVDLSRDAVILLLKEGWDSRSHTWVAATDVTQGEVAGNPEKNAEV